MDSKEEVRLFMRLPKCGSEGVKLLFVCVDPRLNGGVVVWKKVEGGGG